jgi:hypothetical protein
MSEDNGRNWKRPISVRYATIIRENRVVSAIANVTDIDPEPPFLDKIRERFFEIREVGPEVNVGDILPPEVGFPDSGPEEAVAA